jgi:hypothetical protein
MTTLQCENTLNSWRSDVGKAGYMAVLEFWQANPATFSSSQARATYVEWALHGLRFVFRDPDAPNVSPCCVGLPLREVPQTDIGTI